MGIMSEWIDMAQEAFGCDRRTALALVIVSAPITIPIFIVTAAPSIGLYILCRVLNLSNEEIVEVFSDKR